jgi:putative Mg2+ transporter-C (MgtC) family protein
MTELSAPADLMAIAVRLTLAVVLGGAIGLNRELQMKPAGLRTHAIVSLGAALVTAIGFMMSAPGTSDPSAAGRIIQGLLAGVGFIGAGVILHRDDTKGVHGLTTASSIWLCAAIGVATGAGLWKAGAIAAALGLIVLVVGRPIDLKLRAWNQPNEPK